MSETQNQQIIDITMSANVNELFAALSKAQGHIQPAPKDKSNPFFKSKYADLSNVWDACRGSLSENGLSVIQIPQTKSTGMYLTTILGHSSGQWIRGDIMITLAKYDPQSVGSAITYFRRYCLSSFTGVSPEDDDGEKAQSSFRKSAETVKFSSNEVSNEKDQLPTLIEVEGFKNKFPNIEPELVDRYLEVLADKTKNTKQTMVGIAMKNESYFLTQFTKWKDSFPKEKVG